MKRREFLIKSARALALASAAGGGGLLFHNRDITSYQPILTKTKNFEVSPDPAWPKVTEAKNEDAIRALHSALDAIGGIKRFVKPGETVTIKPNIGWDRTPAQAANTNPLLVAEMAQLCVDAGASEVIVTDVSVNDPRRCFVRSGIRAAVPRPGVRLLIPAESDFVRTNLNGDLLTIWPVMIHFVTTDRLINMPIAKHHSASAATVGMKNLYGILGGRREQLHQKIAQSIVELAAFCRPTLTVVDATRVLLRSGPQGGSLDDVAIENSVLCATDQVAADSRAVEFIGMAGDKIEHIKMAHDIGLGNLDYRQAGYKLVV